MYFYDLVENSFILWLIPIFPIFIIFAINIIFKTIGNFDELWNEFIENERLTRTCVILWILGLILSFNIYNIGTKDLDNFFCKPCFKFKGYVYAVPKKENVKCYRVKADMEKRGKYYIVNKIYFNNGGYLEFDNEYSNAELESNGKMIYGFEDNHGKEWGFRFYGEDEEK